MGWQANTFNQPNRPERASRSNNRQNSNNQPIRYGVPDSPNWNACHKATSHSPMPVAPDGIEYDTRYPGYCYYLVQEGAEGQISIQKIT